MPSEEQRGSATSEQLQVLYDVSRELATFTDLDNVCRFATRRAREIFQAEGCALILLDRERNEFTFPAASQRESGTVDASRLAEVRFPADRGIAGWVAEHDQATIVEDTSKDERFFGGVDLETHVQTRSLLCAPLRTGSATIGVVEVINPGASYMTREWLQFLETLGNEIAVAHEKAGLYEQLRGEVVSLRKVCRAAGFALAGGGAILALLVAAAHRARVLPWAELFGRRGMVTATLLVIGGAVLVAVARERAGSRRR